MNVKNITNALLIFSLFLHFRAFSQESTGEPGPAFQLSATYKGDFVSNLRGGIKTGTTYLGLADLFIGFDTEKAGLWKGGGFLVHGANSHGGEPSGSLIGDFQVASNIEAGNHTFLYELWYRQTVSNITGIVGLQDLNAEFAASDVASLFLNSSFGIHSVIADNILAPIFPLTSPGITLKWDPSGEFALKTAVYKGCPIDFDSNPYNLNWSLDYLRGLLWVTEARFSRDETEVRPNVLKAGAFYHHHCPESDVVNSETGNRLAHDWGLYVVGDHQLTASGDEGKGLSAFYQLGVSPRNDNFAYLGAGFAYTGLLSRKGADVLGLAMARGLLTKERGKDETSVELTYKAQLTDQIYLQPDMQYIIHPGGTDVQLKNALVGFLRLGLEF